MKPQLKSPLIAICLVLSLVSCNHIKKITDKNIENSHVKKDEQKDSLSVSEDLTRLQNAYFKSDDKEVNISFYDPQLSHARQLDTLLSFWNSNKDSIENKIWFNDTGETLSIDLGKNIPVAISYINKKATAAATDSLHTYKDSTVDKGKIKTDAVTEKKEVHKNKEASRMPWYLFAIIAILLAGVTYCYYKFKIKI